MLSRVGQVNHYNVRVGTPNGNVDFLSAQSHVKLRTIAPTAARIAPREFISRALNPSAAQLHADSKHQPGRDS